MKFIVDASILLMVGQGDWVKLQFLGYHRKCDVAVPEPVVLRTAAEVRSLPQVEAVKRWTMLLAEMPRVPWTAAVTEKMLALEPPPGMVLGLDAITAAHALAHDATVLTMDRTRYEWVAGLRVDELL